MEEVRSLEWRGVARCGVVRRTHLSIELEPVLYRGDGAQHREPGGGGD